jgi:TetR/AcrR family transcriptional regulator
VAQKQAGGRKTANGKDDDKVDTRPTPRTRIQKRNTEAILDAALDIFSTHGFSGATLDRIAEAARLSKPNLLYYFASKEAIHRALISETLDTWLAPLRELEPDGDPVEEIVAYALRKLDMARAFPRESRFFAHEILQGAPRVLDIIEGPLRELVDDKARLIAGWAEAGRIAAVDPHHLIFSIWATTQHYADFDAQVRGILRPEGESHFEDAAAFLDTLYRRLLAPTA